jgi:hypothetical protein
MVMICACIFDPAQVGCPNAGPFATSVAPNVGIGDVQSGAVFVLPSPLRLLKGGSTAGLTASAVQPFLSTPICRATVSMAQSFTGSSIAAA